ncbi:GOLPH3/VPS74 family protein [Glycomyces xiaoerkulensis]|uniref:GOLPH3/VPS74 family protein n=1 Tax=Glycomyces xiaoerkulensis TaxID=2038139 RepID=UPI000C262496|nr:GPP34 family phosphoprotein [Glycomyces xiaoerkulensis]
MELKPPVSGGPARLVYDAVWLAGYGDIWKPPVADYAAGLGIGAALLAELIPSGRIAVVASGDDQGHLVMVNLDPRARPSDVLRRGLWEQIRAEPQPLPVRAWLDFLTVDGVFVKAADHMVSAGLMERHELATRGRWRRRTETAYWPVEPLVAAAPFHRLRRWLDGREASLPVTDVFLLGLTEAVGLHRHLFCHRTGQARKRAVEAQRHLPRQLRALLAHLGDAVSSAATARTF